MAKKAFIEVPWRPVDAVVVFVVGWFAAPLLFVLYFSIFSFVPLFHDFLKQLSNSGLAANLILVAFSAVTAFLVVGLYLRRHKSGLSAIGLKKFKFLQAVLYVAIGFVVLYASVAGAYKLVQLLWPHFNANQPQVNQFTSARSASEKLLSFLALVVVAPLIEEIVFRGFMFPAFTKRMGVIWGAIVTSIFFGIAHWQLNVSIYTIMLSLILCGLYYKLRSIWPGIAFHMLNNYLAFLAIMHK